MSKVKTVKVRPVQRFKSHPGYRFASMVVKIERHDTDIKLLLPTGVELLVQYRIENETVDICLSKDEAPHAASVYVTDADLQPVRKRRGALPGEQITIFV